MSTMAKVCHRHRMVTQPRHLSIVCDRWHYVAVVVVVVVVVDNDEAEQERLVAVRAVGAMAMRRT